MLILNLTSGYEARLRQILIVAGPYRFSERSEKYFSLALHGPILV